MSPQPSTARSGRAFWGMVAFLSLAAIILLLVWDRYLLPTMLTVPGADPTARKQMAAISLLTMMVVLVALLAVLLIVVRPGRLFLPRKASPRTRTPYVDAWTESARRLQTPPKDR